MLSEREEVKQWGKIHENNDIVLIILIGSNFMYQLEWATGTQIKHLSG